MEQSEFFVGVEVADWSLSAVSKFFRSGDDSVPNEAQNFAERSTGYAERFVGNAGSAFR